MDALPPEIALARALAETWHRLITTANSWLNFWHVGLFKTIKWWYCISATPLYPGNFLGASVKNLINILFQSCYCA
jgi:hypothetical protein